MANWSAFLGKFSQPCEVTSETVGPMEGTLDGGMGLKLMPTLVICLLGLLSLSGLLPHPTIYLPPIPSILTL